jgi:PIN domain nuclease of toxin-antitoxin system
MPERLSDPARASISSGGLWLSVASYWEIIIKTGKRLLDIPDPESWWNRAVQLLGANVLPIRASHVSVIAKLPEIHRDPFDRILVAQSIAEGLPLVTSDRNIAAYSVRIIW